MSEAPDKPRPKNDEGEHRLSHYCCELLERVLTEPCWFTAQDHSGRAIGGSPQTQINWRNKQKWYGVKPSQLDIRIYQSPIYAEIELKYGDGKPTAGQGTTMRLLSDRGIPTGCCWTLQEFYDAVVAAGFKLHGNAANILTEITEKHAAAERAARVGKKPATKRRKPRTISSPGNIRRSEAVRKRILF